MKYHYKENYTTMKKEIEEDIRRWKDGSHLWIDKILQKYIFF
jgi:hypothetical protein